VDQRTSRAVTLAAAKAVSGMGIFLLVAAGYGYINSANDPGHETGTSLTMVVIGVVLAVGGRLLQARIA
jgi:hypothetical protein